MNEELDLLKERAKRMGINFHPSIGIDTLKEKMEEHTGEKKAKVVVAEPEKETIPQRNARMRKEANRLVRIRLTCMNPARKNWPGEIISVSNSAIGSIKKFIPFNADAGWYIPKVLLHVLQERVFQSFYTVSVEGQKVKRTKLVKEFAIEMLPDLTVKELKDLAIKQALNATAERL